MLKFSQQDKNKLISNVSTYNIVHSSSNTAVTLIALVITTIFCYDEFIKSSNNKGFLLQTI